MNLAVLRLEGERAVLDALVGRLSLEANQTWKEGELRRNGTPHKSSGLSATVADVPTPAGLMEEVRAFVSRCKQLAVSFSGVRAELSVGLTVGDSEQFVACLEFSKDDLAMLAERGLTLSVTAYPTSDAANRPGAI
jgi:hypothetical protein